MPRCTSLSYPPDDRLSRMLIAYIATGVSFMLIPGTLVGVMTLLKISANHTAHDQDRLPCSRSTSISGTSC